MLNFFKRRKNHKQVKDTKSSIQMVDLEGLPLKVGDLVMCLRYDLGKCRIVEGDKGLEYESLTTGQRVHYARMIDAATSYQKVRKILE